ncbi:MAG: dienelactone hydrolase family protein [Sciscionella sp.]
MSSSPKQLFTELSGQGPHEVRRGETALVGLPGLVFTPRSGSALPAVAFGHGLLQPPVRYTRLLRHLASWGIVAAAPATQLGPLPSHQLFAADLRTTLDICTGVQLGDGEISVDQQRLGLAGHSMGAAGAVLAAAKDTRVRAVCTLALTASRPPALDAARSITAPGLHIAAEQDRIAPVAGHAEPVAMAWQGPVQLRIARKASHLGFTEGRHWSELMLDGKPEYTTHRTARTLLTAFLLVHLNGEERYRPLLEGEFKAAPLEYSHEEFVTSAAAR